MNLDTDAITIHNLLQQSDVEIRKQASKQCNLIEQMQSNLPQCKAAPWIQLHCEKPTKKASKEI